MGKISRRTIIGQHGRKQGRKSIGFEALLRNGSKMPKRGHGYCIRIIKYNKEKFSVSKTLNSVSGLHRSLFHPLATVRHRI